MDTARDAKRSGDHLRKECEESDEDADREEEESRELQELNENIDGHENDDLKSGVIPDANSDDDIKGVSSIDKKEMLSKIETLEKVIMDLKLDLWKEMTDKNDLINKCYVLEKMWKNSIQPENGIIIHRLKTLNIIKTDGVYEVMSSIDLSLFQDANFESYKQCAETLESISGHLSRRTPSKILVLINGYSGAMIAYLALLASHVESFSASPQGFVIAKATRDDSLSLKQHYSYLIDAGLIKINIFGANYVLSKGYAKLAPYDVIIIPEVGWSETLKNQLKIGGIFINPFENNVKLIKQINGTLIEI